MALSKLDQLYRQVILDHSKHPHHYGSLAIKNNEIELNNPTCGDVIKLQIQLDNHLQKVTDAKFTGHGCSISTASASMMCDAIIGQDVQTAQKMIEQFLHLVQGEDVELDEALEEVAVLQGVAKFPARIKCATLAWKALEQALDSEDKTSLVQQQHKLEEEANE